MHKNYNLNMMFVNFPYIIYHVTVTTEGVNFLPATFTINKIINSKIKVTKTSGMFVRFLQFTLSRKRYSNISKPAQSKH